MGLFETKPKRLISPIALKAGYFGAVDRQYILPIVDLPADVSLEMQQLPQTCMFRLYKALVDGEHVGYGLSSAFKVFNHGGYLLTRTERFTKPETFSIVLRLPEIVLCDYANAGAIAISPKVSTAVANIFMEQ